MNMDSATVSVSGWQAANLAFWAITVVVIVSAAVAALSRSIVQAAFALFFTLLGIAGYYVLLGSGFLAVTQVIIYVGGILVLIMFGILLTNRSLLPEQQDSSFRYVTGALLGVFLFVVIEIIIVNVPWTIAGTLAEPASDVRPLGRLLITKYLLPFEVAGMTLLLCLVGAAYLVRRREG
jgi:NADH:ubiquinone oxidoreductase subunit 6 (subunit J)